MSPLAVRRWRTFQANRRGFWSLCLFVALFTTTLFAEFIANDKPLVVSYQSELFVPDSSFPGRPPPQGPAGSRS